MLSFYSPFFFFIYIYVRFSHSVMSDSLWPHGLKYSRLTGSSPTPGAYSNSCPSHWWCHQTISSSVSPFSSCLQSFPESGSFLMSQFFASDGQSTGVSALISVIPINIQDWFPLGWTGWISLQLSQWCHPTISFSVVPFSFCLQSFAASGSFPRSQLFASGGQSIGVSALISVLPMNIQDWFPLGWTGWISLQSKGLSRVLSNTTVQKHKFFSILLSS